MLLYQLYDFQRAALTPLRLTAETLQQAFTHPFSPVSYTPWGRAVAAGAEVVERSTRQYGKPEFGVEHVAIDGAHVPVTIEVAARRTFCDLLHFRRDAARDDPKVLLVAPLSGHHATLLRGTVAGLLPEHDVYITDWLNASDVPLDKGRFGLDEYIEELIGFFELLGRDTHVVAVCQPSVPVLAATAILSADNNPAAPRTMTLMGGPIDTRVNPTQVNRHAKQHSLDWFERTVISAVPAAYPGFMRRVYPGFVQLSGFLAMNPDRHFGAVVDHFNHLVEGDGESAGAHRSFYDEYLAVMDLAAEFFLETVRVAFQEHDLPRGCMTWRGSPVEPRAIARTALLTIEGELDDISAPGQTVAAHDICSAIPHDRRRHRLQKGVGHYGIFNGRRWLNEIMPELRDFIRAHR